MTVEEVADKAFQAAPIGITEVHIVSGLHPELPFDYYLEVVRRLKKRLPTVHIQAFTAVEIKYFSEISGLSIRETLEALKEAGLGSLPGGGAEVFSERIRSEFCPKKASADEWLEVMRCAHSIGLRSNATILYGHVETAEEVIDHFVRLRELQDETGGFQSFIPLPFHPENTKLEEIAPVSAVEQLRMFAVSRLMLDNFDHVKAFWIMVGLKVAQISLSFGVDDLDGTVVEEKIVHAAGAQTDQSITKGDLTTMIREAGRVPVERDTLYNTLAVYS
jgi:aminodeoxyfutalosine synthase